MKPSWWVALVVFALGVIPESSQAQPLFGDAPSIECTILNAGSLMVGTIDRLEPNPDGSAVVTLAVERTLRGEHYDRLAILFSVVGAYQLQDRREARLLVAAQGDPLVGQTVIDLSSPDLAVLTADFALLKTPDAVIEAARATLQRRPGVERIATFRRVVPVEAVSGTRWKSLYGTGGYLLLDVPVDDRLARWARETLEKPGRLVEREAAARALRFFRSDENVALAKSLLTDPNWAYQKYAEQNRGVEVRSYVVRAAAYATLTYWGVPVDQPVIREEVVKRDAVTFVDLITRPDLTDAELDDLARFPNLKFLNLSGSPVTDARLRRVADLKGLRTLYLAATEVTDAGLLTLAGLPVLEDLNLMSTRVSDAALPTLAGLDQLRTLDISNTAFTAAGVAELRRLRPDLTVRH